MNCPGFFNDPPSPHTPAVIVSLEGGHLVFRPVNTSRRALAFSFKPNEQIPAGLFAKYCNVYEAVMYEPSKAPKKTVAERRRETVQGLRMAEDWLRHNTVTKKPRKVAASVDIDLSDLGL